MVTARPAAPGLLEPRCSRSRSVGSLSKSSRVYIGVHARRSELAPVRYASLGRCKMELGSSVGQVGKMGMNMVERLRRDRHKIVAFDIDDAKLSQSPWAPAVNCSRTGFSLLRTRFRSRGRTDRK